MLNERESTFLDRAYEKYARSLFSRSLSMLRPLPDAASLAEECVQETFETALRKIGILWEHPSPESWLFETCRNITLTKRRKALNRRRITDVPARLEDTRGAADVRDRIEEWIERHDAGQKKRQLMRTLTEQEHAVFRVYFEEELSLKESAEKLGLSENAVRGTVRRIRAKAAKIFVPLFVFLWFAPRF